MEGIIEAQHEALIEVRAKVVARIYKLVMVKVKHELVKVRRKNI